MQSCNLARARVAWRDPKLGAGAWLRTRKCRFELSGQVGVAGKKSTIDSPPISRFSLNFSVLKFGCFKPLRASVRVAHQIWSNLNVNAILGCQLSLSSYIDTFIARETERKSDDEIDKNSTFQFPHYLSCELVESGIQSKTAANASVV